MKKTFDPFILLLNPGDDSGGDDGTGQGGQDPITTPAPNPNVSGPVSFGDWNASVGADVNGDGGVDFSDYGQWWADSGFGMDAWAEFNPDVPFSWGPAVEPEVSE